MQNIKYLYNHVKNYAIMALGTFLLAISINLFLVPHKIVLGGVSGIGTVLYYLFGIPISYSTVILNAPLIYLSYRYIDFRFVIKGIIGTALISFFLSITAPIKPFMNDIMLSTIVGGALSGIGSGLVFLVDGTTGGSDIIAKLIQHFRTNIKIGQALLLSDLAVIALSAVVFQNYELGLYGIVALYLSSKAIDGIIDGINYKKLVFIITDKTELMSKRIMFELERGLTGLKAKGMYTGADKNMLMCVLMVREIYDLKKIIKEVDPNAFVIITDSRDVSGEGFSRRY